MIHSTFGIFRAASAALFLVLAAQSSALAQSSKEKYVADFERMRASVLGIVDSMPAAGLRSAPTPGVRNFAEQIEHVVVGNVNLIASGIDADRTPLGIDKAVYLNDKAELRRFVDIGFDRVRDMLNAMSPEDLAAEGRLFGRIPLPHLFRVPAVGSQSPDR
ncbi:MAG: DinB family protein [Gemmatimonadaceae bacterium]